MLGIGHARCLSHCNGRTQLLQNTFHECLALHKHAKQLLSHQGMRMRFSCFIPRAVPRCTASVPRQAVGCAWEHRLFSAAQLGAGRGRAARLSQSPPCLHATLCSEPPCDGCTMAGPIPVWTQLWQAPACLGTSGKGRAPSATLLGHRASPGSCLPAKCLSLWKLKPVLPPAVLVGSVG